MCATYLYRPTTIVTTKVYADSTYDDGDDDDDDDK